jgi:hypothetical protein
MFDREKQGAFALEVVALDEAPSARTNSNGLSANAICGRLLIRSLNSRNIGEVILEKCPPVDSSFTITSDFTKCLLILESR